MKKYEWTWADVTEAVFNSPNWCANPQSEIFEHGYEIQDFYRDMSGDLLKRIDIDTFEYLNDNFDKRIVCLISIKEV